MNWGPLQDVKFIQVMNSVLDSETPCENGFRKLNQDRLEHAWIGARTDRGSTSAYAQRLFLYYSCRYVIELQKNAG